MRCRVDDEKLAATYVRYDEAAYGERCDDAPRFSDLQRKFARYAQGVERLAAAVRDPTAPGSAQALRETDELSAMDEDLSADLWSYGQALAADDKQLRALAVETAKESEARALRRLER